MSRPGGPYRDDRYPPRQPQYPQQAYPQQGYPQRGYPDQGQGYGPGQGYRPNQGFGPDPGFDPDDDLDQDYSRSGYTPYDEPSYDNRGYENRGLDNRRFEDRGYEDRGFEQRPTPRRVAQERPADTEYQGGFKIPGFGLVLSLLGFAVQVASLTVLPWVTAGGETASLPKIWDLVHDFGTGGFSGTYVLLFSYPLAVLGVLLSLVAVIQSVASKVIWAILAIIGLAVLVLRYGLGPFKDMALNDQPLEFSHKEIVLAIIALAALLVVIVMLRMAMTTFRVVGGIILLAFAGVHVAALNDMSGGDGLAGFGIGAYGPALGYVLAALAAFIGPRKIA